MIKIDERGNAILDGENKRESEEDKIKKDASNQLGYNDYCQDLINLININNYVNGDYTLIFVTEYGYDDDKDDKVIYLKSEESYKKIIVPVKEDGKYDLSNIQIMNVENIEEIINKLDEWFGEGHIVGNGYEYAKLLNLIGKNEKAEEVTRIYSYYLKHQDEIRREKELEEEREKLEITASMEDILNLLREEMEPDSISYGHYWVYETSIMKVDGQGTIIQDISLEEAKECIEAIENAVNNGSLILNENQLAILQIWQEKINDRKHSK